jgi:hypothetical protein
MAEAAEYTVVDDKPAAAEQPKPIEIDVDDATAFALKLQEFDKAIADAEAQAAGLKAQKAAFVYNTNLNNLVARSKQQSAAAAVTPEVAPQ